jgi:hypothetical protein
VSGGRIMPFKGHGNGINNARVYNYIETGDSVWIKHPDFKMPYKRKWARVRSEEEKYIISEREALEYYNDDGSARF